MKNDILYLNSIKHFFPNPAGSGKIEVLNIPELTVRRGEVLAVIGPSGSGKSTLINLIEGFFAPSAGIILKDDKPIQGPGPDRIAVFQKHSLFPWLTVFNNIAYGLRGKNLPQKELEKKVIDILELIGLTEFLKAYPASLSGGMCQRVALARALVLNPDILLLDEPFASLDTVTRFRLQEEVLKLWKQYDLTVILVTHQIEEAVFMADRVAILFPPPRGLMDIIDVPISHRREREDWRLKKISDHIGQLLGV